MSKDPLFFVKHIFESIKNIESFSKKLTKSGLKNDRLRQSAILREIEIIGEAVKNLPIDFTVKYPYIEWSRIAGTRDKIIHHYFGVDYNTVWEIIKSDIPKLKKDISDILEELESKNKDIQN